MAERPKTRKVIISYSATKTDVGKTKEMPADEAAALVAGGRARYADGEKAEPQVKTTPAAAKQTAS